MLANNYIKKQVKIALKEDLGKQGDITSNASSDIALKENIVNIPNPLEMISKIGGYMFDWKDHKSIFIFLQNWFYLRHKWEVLSISVIFVLSFSNKDLKIRHIKEETG